MSSFANNNNRKRKVDYIHHANLRDLESAKNVELTSDNIEDFMKIESKKSWCSFCRSDVSRMDLLKIKDRNICIKCIIKMKLPLKYVYYEIDSDEDNIGEKMYRCDRINHCRPLQDFISHSNRSGYKIYGICRSCRIIRRIEYSLKLKKIGVK